MKRVSEEVLRRAGGREIALYGCSEMAEALKHMFECTGCKISIFSDKNYHQFYHLGCEVISSKCLSPKRYFPVIVPFGENAIQSMINHCLKLGYQPKDWFVWSREVDYDIVFNGVVLGRHFQLSKALIRYDACRCIKSVGRFCSINHTFHYGKDHSFYLSTSSQIPIPDLSLSCSGSTSLDDSKLEIGNDVWIGAQTFINCSKVKHIGNGAVIATGAVVLEDVPPYAIVAGVPAKIKKYRFSEEQIAILEQVQWWNWSDEEIAAHVECFLDYNLFFERFKS